ncbi:MBL fold metallo-hydrolase [bacterium]|nr:MBL fold metallo-hydrolase [bacterium]
MKILQLGKASAVPPEGQYNASYVIDAGGQLILIDTPPSIITQLNNARIKPEQIDWIAITHQHGDHLLGLPMLLVYGYALFPDKIWRIIVQDFLIDTIRHLIEIAYPELLHKRPFFTNNIQFYPISNPTDFLLELSARTTIRAASTCHGVPCTAIRIGTADQSVTYSADTGFTEPVVELAQNTSLLIHEAGLGAVKPPPAPAHHSTAEQAGTAAQRAHARELWLTHLSDCSETGINGAVRAARNSFGGTVRVVDDFIWIPVTYSF